MPGGRCAAEGRSTRLGGGSGAHRAPPVRLKSTRGWVLQSAQCRARHPARLTAFVSARCKQSSQVHVAGREAGVAGSTRCGRTSASQPAGSLTRSGAAARLCRELGECGGLLHALLQPERQLWPALLSVLCSGGEAGNAEAAGRSAEVLVPLAAAAPGAPFCWAERLMLGEAGGRRRLLGAAEDKQRCAGRAVAPAAADRAASQPVGGCSSACGSGEQAGGAGGRGPEPGRGAGAAGRAAAAQQPARDRAAGQWPELRHPAQRGAARALRGAPGDPRRCALRAAPAVRARALRAASPRHAAQGTRTRRAARDCERAGAASSRRRLRR